MTSLPIVLTMGEPAGVGPELIIKAKKILKNKYPFYVIGDYNYLTSIAKKSSIDTREITHFSELKDFPDQLCIIHQRMPEKIIPGTISLKNSAAVKQTIEIAVSCVKKRHALAIVTNPINKWALKHDGNFPYEGHTDFLAALDAKRSNSAMMLVNRNNFRVVPITIHIPIKKVSNNLTPQLIEETIKIVHNSLRYDYKIKQPKIVVIGLNPHAGENTAIGYEEFDIISPIIKKLNNEGLVLNGPIAADTAFSIDKRSLYDAFICMYHDQALIPIKMMSFDESINITLGLSFVRTSPDHGTALDIAGKNSANPSSLILAIEEAQKLANARQKNEKY